MEERKYRKRRMVESDREEKRLEWLPSSKIDQKRGHSKPRRERGGELRKRGQIRVTFKYTMRKGRMSSFAEY